MDIYEKIKHYLMLKSLEIRDISLYHGRMGIVLTLYLYAQKKNDDNLKNFAWDLLQTIYNNVYDNMPYGLECGFAGIGYGITMLKKYGIFDCNLNSVLYDIDNKIMAYDPRRITDISFRNGLLGIYYYIQQRSSVEKDIYSFDTTYLKELQTRVNRISEPIQDKKTFNIAMDLQRPLWNIQEYVNKELGLDSGISYYLFTYCKKN
ncbi:MAG: hypothetical protein IJA46_06655 [Bacteroidaceae bacterium]|nr:hypothetical protein [Bacteroidaceae bacterium]